MSQCATSQADVSLTRVEGHQIEEELFQELKGVMEKEVAEMTQVASRRMFLQKIAAYSAVVPVAVLAMATDVLAQDRGCLVCVTNTGAGCSVCNSCIADTCILWDPNEPGCGPPCMNCQNQGRQGCLAGRCDENDEV